jgi:16S rRNA (uracil1498-N3)-methyltransferase
MPPRFYISGTLPFSETKAVLNAEESRHLSRVLRLSKGDEIRLFDASGAEFKAIVERAAAKKCELRIVERSNAEAPSLPRLTVGFSMIRSEPMRWLVQKATELGVERLAPFVSERTTATDRAAGAAAAAFQARCKRISLASCKQSGRNRPLEVSSPQAFKDFIDESAGAAAAFLAWEGGGAAPLGHALNECQASPGAEGLFALAIGPEGGFSESEYDFAVEQGFKPVNLGPYILRAETAAIAAASLILNWPAWKSPNR